MSPGGDSGTEAHISSLVVHVRPELADAAAQQIGSMEYAEVPLTGTGGKLIVCLETPTLSHVTESIGTISALRGVLSCALVSHHAEDRAELDRPVPETLNALREDAP